MKWIRWSGFAAFVIITLLLGVLGFFFIDNFAKRGLEAAGFAVNGAEVNVADVDLTLSPLGFQFNGIEIANPQQPDQNSLVIESARVQLNFYQLFLGRVRLQDVSVTEIATDQPRQRPAKVAEVNTNSETSSSGDDEQQASEAKAESKTSLASRLPSTETVVNTATAKTRAAVDQAEQQLEQSQAGISTAVASLPGDEELNRYRARVKQLQGVELKDLKAIESLQKQMAELTGQLAKDKLTIETSRAKIRSAINDGKASIEAVVKAPAQDWQQLKADYPLNADTAVKAGRLLLGDSFFDRVDQAKGWYEQAKPWLSRLRRPEEQPKPERMQGTFVRFPHPDPTATFQWDKGELSFNADGSPWQLTIQDLTSHRGDLFKPTRVQLQKGPAESIDWSLSALFDRENDRSVDTFRWQGEGVSFASQSIALAGTQLNWKPKPAAITGQLVVSGGQLKGASTLTFSENEFQIDQQSDAGKLLSKAFQDISTFKVMVDIAGTLKAPKVSVTSDLDNQVSQALNALVKDEYERWLASSRKAIESKAQELRKPLDAQLAKLQEKQQQVEHEVKAFEAEVTAELKKLEDKLAAEQARLEGELKAAAEAARKKAEAARKEAEEAAKKAAEDKLKEEANKLKDKFNF